MNFLEIRYIQQFYFISQYQESNVRNVLHDVRLSG